MYGVTRASNRAHRFHILEISYDEPKFEHPAASSHREQARSLFSARKIALMASVVAGLGVAVNGLGSSASSHLQRSARTNH